MLSFARDQANILPKSWSEETLRGLKLVDILSWPIII